MFLRDCFRYTLKALIVIGLTPMLILIAFISALFDLLLGWVYGPNYPLDKYRD